MSIKYNQFGEVISVNGVTTGQRLGKPMQDAKPKKAEHNEAYAIAKKTVGNIKNVVDDKQPENIGDELEERIEALEAGGDGGAILDSNGKLKSEVLPEGYPYETVTILVPEQTITTEAIPDYDGFCTAELNMPLPVSGKTCNVIFNGDTYVLKTNEYGHIGNMGLVDGENTGEPFLILGDMIVTATPMTFTLSVFLMEITKLDNKFLNDDVALYGRTGALTRIEWDGNTTGLDYFTDNDCTFYKVSDFVVPYPYASSVKAERSDGYETDDYSQKQYGWLVNGYTAAVVTDAENNNIPSNGVYFRHQSKDGLRCLWMEIDTHKENSILYLNSPSGKKYAITVDDSGTLKATIR